MRSAPVLRAPSKVRRAVDLGKTSIPRGGTGIVPVTLLALGDEDALGFTVTFDPTRLQFAGAQLVGAAAGAALNVNASQAAQGRVGLALMLPLPGTFPAGRQEILELTFQALVGAPTGLTPLGFSDAVVICQVSNTLAAPLPATYSAGSVRVAR